MSTAVTNPLDLGAVVEHVELLDDRTVLVGDHVVAATEALEPAVTRAIYSRLYLGLAEDVADPADRRPATSREDATYVDALIRADGGRVHWSPGWRVTAVEPAYTEVRSEVDGVHVVATAAEVRPRRHAVGDRVHVAFPTERRFVSRGFYLTHGLAGAVPADRPCLRWYLNAPPSSAAQLFGDLIAGLDTAGLAYTIKTINDPASPPRPDAMVLYTSRGQAAGGHVHAALLGATLRERVPAFTRRLAAGVAVADDVDGGGLSFGLHRSMLVARGVIAAGSGARATARRNAVEVAFEAAGLDPARPHLGAGAEDLAMPWWSA